MTALVDRCSALSQLRDGVANAAHVAGVVAKRCDDLDALEVAPKPAISPSPKSVASRSVFRKAARRALLRALGWGSRLAFDEKPIKSNQTKSNQTKPNRNIEWARSSYTALLGVLRMSSDLWLNVSGLEFFCV